MSKKEEHITLPKTEYDQLVQETALLKAQLSELQRMIYGAKSERFVSSVPSDQLSLFAPGQEAEEQDVATEQITYERKKQGKEKQHPVRAALPPHLPREEEIIEPDELSSDVKKIGEEVTEILEYRPGKLYVRKIIRPKYVEQEKSEDGNQISIAELPHLPIPKGNAGAGLLAHIQVSKWVDHLPYYRQVQIFKREGVRLAESTINGWFTATCDLLTPLYEELIKQIQVQDYLQADESPIKVQDGHNNKAIHTGYHWVYHAPKAKLAAFNYQPTRSREGPSYFLKNFQGKLQTDGYTAYNQLEHKDGVTLLACMAHARRYYEKALDNDQQRAGYALTIIQQLYALEREANEQEFTTKQRKELRQLKAIPLLNQWKSWLDQQHGQVLPKSSIGKAINYSLSLYKRLYRYVEDGSLLIDNNPIENLIRPLALGKKNYLFAGSHAAAQRAAMMYSFFATCKINEVEPYQWLKDVLERIPNQKVNQIDLLLPHNWSARYCPRKCVCEKGYPLFTSLQLVKILIKFKIRNRIFISSLFHFHSHKA